MEKLAEQLNFSVFSDANVTHYCLKRNKWFYKTEQAGQHAEDICDPIQGVFDQMSGS